MVTEVVLILSSILAFMSLAISLVNLGIAASRGCFFLILMVVLLAGLTTYAYESSASLLYLKYERFSSFRALIGSIPGFDVSVVWHWYFLGGAVSFVIANMLGLVFLMITLPLYRQSFVRGSRILSRHEMRRKLRRVGCPIFSPVKIGQYALPTSLETRSLLTVGEPGAGKTQVIKGVVGSCRKRRARVIGFDAGAELASCFAKPGDFLLSCEFKGSKRWSPFAEIRSLADCKSLAESGIPQGTGESVAWNQYAREIYSNLMFRLYREGHTTNRALVNHLQVTKIEDLRALTLGTSVQRIFEEGNERMLGSVLAVMNTHLSWLAVLDPNAGAQSFSLRSFIEGKYGGGSLWMPYRETNAAATAPMRNTWANILIKSALSLSPDRDRRMLLVLDELAANGEIGVLPDAVSRGRKYGLSVMAGIQSIPQLREIYGRDRASNILGSFGHVVALRSPDPDTADYLSRAVGDSEVVNDEFSSHSEGGVTTRSALDTKRAVLPSEIQQLPDRAGYLKISTIGWSSIKIPLIRHKINYVLKEKPVNYHVGLTESRKRPEPNSDNLDKV